MKTDPEKRILENRNNLRIKNLEIEIKIWKHISKLDKQIATKEVGKRVKLKYGKIDFQNLGFSKKRYQKMIERLHKSLFRINKDQYDLSSIKDIELNDLKDFTKKLFECPYEIQLYFATEPNKQGEDEKLQIKMLNEGLNTTAFMAHRPKDDYYINKDQINKKKSDRTKSIDVFVIKNNLEIDSFEPKSPLEEKCFFGSCKAIITQGGHQKNVSDELESFVDKANKYCSETNNQALFFIQCDGSYANKIKPNLRKCINNNDRIFIGDTLEVVDWIKNK